jgi:prevent-host-death family protein
MKLVSVAVLKQKLSAYLHLVEEGEELVITAHRRPVARVIPNTDNGLHVRPPIRSPHLLRKLAGIRLTLPGRTAVDTLLEERTRR